MISPSVKKNIYGGVGEATSEILFIFFTDQLPNEKKYQR